MWDARAMRSGQHRDVAETHVLWHPIPSRDTSRFQRLSPQANARLCFDGRVLSPANTRDDENRRHGDTKVAHRVGRHRHHQAARAEARMSDSQAARAASFTHGASYLFGVALPDQFLETHPASMLFSLHRRSHRFEGISAVKVRAL